MDRIAEVTQIPTSNSESFQILRYEVGQRYATHHDSSMYDLWYKKNWQIPSNPILFICLLYFIRSQTKLASGPRILTFFLYLSDVEEGGETSFPSLGISVKPKKGRALLWPSTLSSDPNSIDGRTMHEAKPVIRGTKYAANAWIHLYNFEHSNLWGCTGTFDNL